MKIIIQALLEEHLKEYNKLVEFKPYYDTYRKLARRPIKKWARRPIKKAWPPKVSYKQIKLA